MPVLTYKPVGSIHNYVVQFTDDASHCLRYSRYTLLDFDSFYIVDADGVSLNVVPTGIMDYTEEELFQESLITDIPIDLFTLVLGMKAIRDNIGLMVDSQKLIITLPEKDDLHD